MICALLTGLGTHAMKRVSFNHHGSPCWWSNSYSRGDAVFFTSLVLATPLRLHIVYIDGAGLISQGARRQWLISFLVHEQIAISRLQLGQCWWSCLWPGDLEMKGRVPWNGLLHLMGSPFKQNWLFELVSILYIWCFPFILASFQHPINNRAVWSSACQSCLVCAAGEVKPGTNFSLLPSKILWWAWPTHSCPHSQALHALPHNRAR